MNPLITLYLAVLVLIVVVLVLILRELSGLRRERGSQSQEKEPKQRR